MNMQATVHAQCEMPTQTVHEISKESFQFQLLFACLICALTAVMAFQAAW